MRILIVDDDPHAARRLATALVHRQLEVRAVATASEARASAAAFDPDLLVVAELLPDLSGLALAAEIERAEFPRRPAVVLAAAQRPDPEAARAAGIDWHLSTPVDSRRLLLLVGAYDEYLHKVISEDELEDTGWKLRRPV